ncbi:hypothetical protein DFA_10910 [Cavenderia fasciculata]|uniref:Importin N-terminal domain-containing protein n=1 Tax=Cavenderia fasciculata TaxID=261658 RepID=F4QBR4_CACFS|nr:uncharacterized protein DFA_10910 [Cavenderia fasciculata]EGG14652.1 hypothetical protein DFA_10910 [Cavenderia fasciculata]|eukprot:XP_004351160.1 hypothetical protein DFA_10910 [Cavenderia fasciculata]
MSEQQIITLFKLAATAPEANVREEASNNLKNIVKVQGGLISLLQLIDTQQDSFIKQLGAIYFKNHVKENWKKGDQVDYPIYPSDKETIKASMVELILRTQQANVKSQLIEAMNIIGEAEFPINWPSLLGDIMNKISSTTDYNTINTLLEILNTLLCKYRPLASDKQVLLELREILDTLPKPYLELFNKTGNLIKQSGANFTQEQAKSLFTSVHLQLEIFLSMSSVDLPEFFEDNLETFSTDFLYYLNYRSTNPGLINSKSDEEPSLLNQVHTSVCDIVNLYIGVYDDEFSQYLDPFVRGVWELLSQTPNEVRYDSLTYSAIKFIGSVSMSIRHSLFAEEGTLRQICSHIVAPNIKLRESDVELFEDNQTEYIRRDIEGSDSDTRRRASIELVKGLRKYYEQKVTQMLSVDINNLLAEYRANPAANWASKDSAIFLVTALAVKSDSGTATANALVPIVQFFETEIVPEITNAATTNPILLADCLKFITIFRTQLPNFEAITKLVAPCLTNPNYVIHTYAATCIDRLLTVRDPTTKQPRLSVAFVLQNVGDFLRLLIGVLGFPESRQNERVMRTVVRIVLMLIGKIDLQLTVDLLQKFTSIVVAEADNPTNHTFNHYCFEAIGSLLKSFADRPEAFTIVTPLISLVLSKDVQEFTPYTFQLLSILVENAPPQNLQTYRDLLAPLYHPNLFKNQANIPPLVRLYQAFFKKDGAFVVEKGHIEPILGVFRLLIASPINDHEGFYIVESIVENLPFALYENYMKPIFEIILERVSKHKTEKLLRCFIIFLGLVIHKLSIQKTIETINKIRVGLWADIIAKVWIVTSDKVTGKIEKKILSVAMTQMLCSSEMYTSIQDAWVHILDCQYKLLNEEEAGGASNGEAGVANEDQQEAIESAEGYVPSFAQLQFTKKPDTDPVAEISDYKTYFAQHVKPLYQQHSAQINQLLQKCQNDKQTDTTTTTTTTTIPPNLLKKNITNYEINFS